MAQLSKVHLNIIQGKQLRLKSSNHSVDLNHCLSGQHGIVKIMAFAADYDCIGRRTHVLLLVNQIAKQLNKCMTMTMIVLNERKLQNN